MDAITHYCEHCGSEIRFRFDVKKWEFWYDTNDQIICDQNPNLHDDGRTYHEDSTIAAINRTRARMRGN